MKRSNPILIHQDLWKCGYLEKYSHLPDGFGALAQLATVSDFGENFVLETVGALKLFIANEVRSLASVKI